MTRFVLLVGLAASTLYSAELTDVFQPIWQGTSEDIRADVEAAYSKDGLRVRALGSR